MASSKDAANKNPLLQQAVDVNRQPGPDGFGAVADQTPHNVIFTREVVKEDENGNPYVEEETDEITLVPHGRRCEPPKGYMRP